MAVTTYLEPEKVGLFSRVGVWFSAVFSAMVVAREAETKRYIDATLLKYRDK